MSNTAIAGSAPSPLVEVTRRDVHRGGEVVESVHHGHLVHVTIASEGRPGTVVTALGDPSLLLFPRSSIKPLQAAACLELLEEAGGEAARIAAALPDDELAIGWASHRAQPAHLAAVGALLARAGLDEGALTCPLGEPADDRTAPRSRLAHNCSGKHALFVVTARLLGLDGGTAPGTPEHRDAVLAIDGPFQSRLLARVAKRTGTFHAVGVDGCGAPAVVLPLEVLAGAFAGLALADGTSGGALGRVREAGLTHPLLVAGSERRAGGEHVPLVDSALLGAGVVAKRGAEGVLAAGWRDADGRGHGVAVKAMDGSLRGASTALVTTLTAAGAVRADVWVEAAPRGGGDVAGTVRPSAELRAAIAGGR